MGWWRFIAPFVRLTATVVAFAFGQALEARRFDFGFAALMGTFIYTSIAPPDGMHDEAWSSSGMGSVLQSVNENIGLSLRR
jgi:hypothetical protein